MTRSAKTLLVSGWAFLLVACGGFVGHGKRAYSEGRYLEASETLAANEAEVPRLSLRKQAEYGIYRGLSLLALGDTTNAAKWLSFAYAIEKSEPNTLNASQRATLDRGLVEMARLMGDQVPPGARVVPNLADARP